MLVSEIFTTQQMLMNVQLTMVDVITSATIQPGALSADVSLDTHWPQMVEHAMVRKAPALSECSFLLTYLHSCYN